MNIETLTLTFTCAYEYTDKDGYGVSEWCETLFEAPLDIKMFGTPEAPELYTYATCPKCENEIELELVIKPTRANFRFGDVGL